MSWSLSILSWIVNWKAARLHNDDRARTSWFGRRMGCCWHVCVVCLLNNNTLWIYMQIVWEVELGRRDLLMRVIWLVLLEISWPQYLNIRIISTLNIFNLSQIWRIYRNELRQRLLKKSVGLWRDVAVLVGAEKNLLILQGYWSWLATDIERPLSMDILNCQLSIDLSDISHVDDGKVLIANQTTLYWLSLINNHRWLSVLIIANSNLTSSLQSLRTL